MAINKQSEEKNCEKNNAKEINCMWHFDQEKSKQKIVEEVEYHTPHMCFKHTKISLRKHWKNLES